MTIPPGTPITFPSPRSKRLVDGLARCDHGTFVMADWDEDGPRTTCLYKGLIVVQPLPADPASVEHAPAQLAIFVDEVPDTSAKTRPLARIRARDTEHDTPAGAMALADIYWHGRRGCRLRDVSAEAVARWRAAGFDIIDVTETLEVI